MSKHKKKLGYIIHYVKPTAQLLFKLEAQYTVYFALTDKIWGILCILEEIDDVISTVNYETLL